MSQKKKNNIIIGSLCVVVLLMVVGYAAFQSVLNIKGTSNVSSNWNIKITNIETKNIVGGASNKEEPTGKGTLTATFNTNLVSPGDSIEYDITVSNQGTLNAVLEKITVSDTNNPAIKFTTSGLTEGDPLTANGGTATLTVKVEYDNNVTTQPNNLKSELNVTLDYVQEGTENITPANNVVYRWTTDSLNIGDSIEGIETTTDYTTLKKDFFLKHTIINEKIESSEVCFIKDENLHCIKPNDYDNTKTNLISILGETSCEESIFLRCDTPNFSVVANMPSIGYVHVNTNGTGCDINSDNVSVCY